jgi:hypothetical protein
MIPLKVFILVGTVDSLDAQFATVELDTSPPSNGGAAIAVLPVAMFPCEVKEGRQFYVVKLAEKEESVIICRSDEDD